MKMLLIKIQTALALGLPNLWRALSYRVGVKTGLNPIHKLKAQLPVGDFFLDGFEHKPVLKSVDTWQKNANYFGWMPVGINNVPDWHFSPLTKSRIVDSQKVWWQIPDFDLKVGDIKAVWEASRFDWVVAFAQQAVVGDLDALQKLNSWLGDWCEHNPAYLGVNWKCGQEASIRVMHLLMTAYLLEQVFTPSDALIRSIEVHLKRIEPTLRYAMAQDNNHGTSEATALFMAGEWLQQVQPSADASRWAKIGRFWIENRVARLIGDDGGFSQYSVNYHRVMLDSLSMAEFWRLTLDVKAFSPLFYRKLKTATEWLYAFTDELTGDAPNIGANDGARLLQLTDTDYRDYRPSVQLAAALFCQAAAYPSKGEYDTPLEWLNIQKPTVTLLSLQSKVFNDGGYALLLSSKLKAYLRYPKFKFRPSQADALHLDVWLGSRNILCDSGSYSYNCEPELQRYFPSTAAHNTIEFDGRNQMPQISRFLFGAWLKTSVFSAVLNTPKQVVIAAYVDVEKARHQRQVELKNTSLVVTDDIQGFKEKAILRWHLPDGDWQLHDNTISTDDISITVSANVTIKRLSLTPSWISRYYLQKKAIVVLEVEVIQSGILTTEINWLS